MDNMKYDRQEFSIVGFQDKISVDFDEDGFGVGRIIGSDLADSLCLFNKKTMTGKRLPTEYQQTELILYPFCGGYSEGRIMVSSIGEVELQYHHNRYPCAGMWGWLDTDFNVVIPPQYIYAMNFVDGQAIVCKGNWNIDAQQRYWCDHEAWGVIDKDGKEIVPCTFDELYEIAGANWLFFVHEGGWEQGHYAIYDANQKKNILELNFDFDCGYMFNEILVTNHGVLVMIDHQPGEGFDYIYAYDLTCEKWIVQKEKYTERKINGQNKMIVNKDGKDIIVF